MKTKYLQRPFKIKAVNDDGSFEGYGSVFDVVDSYREIVVPGAFKQTIEEHMQADDMPALLWQHQHDKPIGVWTHMEEDEHGLRMSGQFAIETQLGKDAHVLSKMKAVKGLSIGFSLYDKGEKTRDDGITELTNIKLWETSIVTFPANPAAQVTDVRSALDSGTFPSVREFEAFLTRDAGFSRTDARTIINQGFKAVTQDADADLIESLDNIINFMKRTQP